MTLMKSISNSIFYLIPLFLPTQLGKHFWPDFSMVSGIRVDYLSPTIYPTDILIFLLFLTWILDTCHAEFISASRFITEEKRSRNKFGMTKKRVRNDNFKITLGNHWKLVIFAAFLTVGILLSKSPVLGFYGFLKLVEFGFFGFYTANYLRNKTQSIYRAITICFVIGIIFESLLGIAHYLNQGSIGGILYFFGEREFNQNTPGIANASLNGELILRPYGTFPHPNVLAGYLVIAMAITISNIKDQISKIKKTFYFFALTIGTIALLLTMSRVAIFIWIAFLIILFLKIVKVKFRFLIGTILILLILISFNLFPQRFTNINLTDESVQLRKELIASSLVMVKESPLFGVGLNNFLVNTTLYLQPVHNVYLLIASEIGLVGFAFFVWFIMRTCLRVKRQKLIILSMVLVLGLFDHYFLTLQQGQLLFSFILGLCWRGKQHI